MTDYVTRAGLEVAPELAAFVEGPLLEGLEVTPGALWSGFAAMLADLAPENARLLERREALQNQIDSWLSARRGSEIATADWEAFLREIGYIVPEGAPFRIRSDAVDPEMSTQAGPQLVVPVMNARFALNAANARWGSLYDALYGTDALPGTASGPGFDPARGAEAVAWAVDFLDSHLPLADGSHRDVTAYDHEAGQFTATMADGSTTGLKDPAQFAGFSGTAEKGSLLLVNNGLHVELVIDRDHPVGAASPAGLRDVVLEAALTAIQDCEDSVAAVDAADKVLAYANWLGLMKGDLAETFEKGGRSVTRRLSPDRSFTAADGSALTLPGRSVQLVRNVGHLMTTDAVRRNGKEIPEGLLDALMTVAGSLHDLKKTEGPRNSRAGSVYVVKPKMHGPEEVAFADATYARVEDILGLPRNTVKLGVMDEEQRTSVNLTECIRAVRDRIVFINTGFLDRTGDEIHTAMQAGPMVPKGEMRAAAWLPAYEDGNVDAGLACGLKGHAQIGKGMWAKPDNMAEMLATKQGHPLSGANTAWVPSPTAAVLHATHYHQVSVAARQAEIAGRERAGLERLLTLPLLGGRNLSADEIAREIDMNCQSILGYVVRWVDQGIGCSKVPDIDDVALMEDRATLRISAQFLTNWLLHGIITEAQIDDSLRRMAVKVDAQNAGDAAYRPMAPAFDGAAFAAARALIIEGTTQPSGYTEPLLHRFRRIVKAA